MRRKQDDYVYEMTSKVDTANAKRLEVCISPYPMYGNQAMAINDGATDGKKVNVGWMEAEYRGWPYVFIVALRDGLKSGQELLIDYSSDNYWQRKAELDMGNQGMLDWHESDMMDKFRAFLGME